MSAQAAHVDEPRDLPTLFGWVAWIEPFWGGKWVVRTRANHVFGPQDDLAAAAFELRRQVAELTPSPTPLHPAEPDGAVLSTRKSAILDALRATGGGMSMAELAAAIDVPKVGLKRSIQQLLADELIVAVGQTRARRYHLHESRVPAEQAEPATVTPAQEDLQPSAPAPTDVPETVAPPLDPISPRVRRELAREEADRAKAAAAHTPLVDPLLRRRIGLYFDTAGRTDTLAGIAGKVNLTGDAVRPTLLAMVAAGALEPIPGTSPTRYRRSTT